jgi:hypothetical protein
VIREYVGTGPLAELVAAADQERRMKREQARRAALAELEEFDRLGTSLNELYRRTDDLTRLALVAVGYHQHKGEWRQCRG